MSAWRLAECSSSARRFQAFLLPRPHHWGSVPGILASLTFETRGDFNLLLAGFRRLYKTPSFLNLGGMAVATDLAELLRELERVTNELENVSRIIEKGEAAHHSAHKPSPILEKLRATARQGPIHPSAQRLLDQQRREQNKTALWMRNERPKYAAELNSLKRRRRNLRARFLAAREHMQATVVAAVKQSRGTAPAQRPVLPRYRSKVKRAILGVLLGNPDAERLSVLDICSQMDNDVADLHEQRVGKEIVSFERAYRDPKLRQDMHRWVDKVKSDLRRSGFME
jgi:hypothetical protein